MGAIAYGRGAYRRDAGNLPELRLVNMFLEQTPTADGGTALLSRPGLSAFASRGAGPVQGLFTQAGTLNGDLFTVSAGTLYRDTTALGLVTGTGPVSFAASATELLVTRGGTLYSYNGTDFVAVAFPDGADVTAVAFVAGLFVAARAGSKKFYWSGVLNGRSFDALDFASAESAPDGLNDIKAIGDNVYLMGGRTIEPWQVTGALDLPFSRLEQGLYRKGVIRSGCAAEIDNGLFWIGDEGIVYRAADVPRRLSDHSIEERVKGSVLVSAFAFVYEGHSFFCVRVDDGAFVFDVATGQWSEFASFGRDRWRVTCAATSGEAIYLGDADTGQVWTFGGVTDGGGVLERVFTAAFPVKGGSVTVAKLSLESNTGQTGDLMGEGADPTVEMRSSRDAGATWASPQSAPLGKQGEYRTRTEYRRCGMFDAPGAMFEFRTTDPVPFRVSGVYLNEPGGGRSRCGSAANDA